MDHREINHHWWIEFDERRMRATILDADGCTEIDVPCEYRVCNVCNGKGTHVNPGIDRHGLSREDFDEDPDFREDYFSGRYDQDCVGCRGKRVRPEPNYAAMTPERRKYVADYIDDFFAGQRDDWRAREYGY